MASPAWESRNARARALGYRSYYDYRVHNYGRSAPSSPPPRGESLARLRGHRSFSDLERAVTPGSLLTVIGHSPRNAQGSYSWVDLVVVQPNGRQLSFRLRGRQLTNKRLKKLVENIDQAGGIISATPSLDIRRLT